MSSRLLSSLLIVLSFALTALQVRAYPAGKSYEKRQPIRSTTTIRAKEKLDCQERKSAAANVSGSDQEVDSILYANISEYGSIDRSRARFSFEVQSSGSIGNICRERSAGAIEADFACYEAIRTSSPLPEQLIVQSAGAVESNPSASRRLAIDFYETSDPSSLKMPKPENVVVADHFFEENRIFKGRALVLHLIPKDAARRWPKIIGADLVDETYNLKAISKRSVQFEESGEVVLEPLLEKFFANWTKFATTHQTCSIDKLLEYQERVKFDFKELFLDSDFPIDPKKPDWRTLLLEARKALQEKEISYAFFRLRKSWFAVPDKNFDARPYQEIRSALLDVIAVSSIRNEGPRLRSPQFTMEQLDERFRRREFNSPTDEFSVELRSDGSLAFFLRWLDKSYPGEYACGTFLSSLSKDELARWKAEAPQRRRNGEESYAKRQSMLKAKMPIVYNPDSPRYQELLALCSPIKPGERKEIVGFDFSPYVPSRDFIGVDDF